MNRLARVVPMLLVLMAPRGAASADGPAQVAVRADIDLIDAASVVAFSAKIGNLEVQAGNGWVRMSVDQRRAFVQAHPSCPPTVVGKDWGAMTVVERGEILRSQPETRQVIAERWDRQSYDDQENFFRRHPEARRRLEKVHGRGWHGGKRGSHGKPGARGDAQVGGDDRGRRDGDGRDARAGGQDDKGKQDQDKDDGKGEGRGRGNHGKGHKHDGD